VTRAWGESDPDAEFALPPHPPIVKDGLIIANGELPGYMIRAISDKPTTISFSPAPGSVGSTIYVGGEPPWWDDLDDNPWSLGYGKPSTSGFRLVPTADGTLVTPDCLCPDLLRHGQLGEADGWRGRVVRAFFWLLRAWPVRP
jgi:hypothetical protein